MWRGEFSEGAAAVQRLAGYHCDSRDGRTFPEDKLTVLRARKIQRFLSQPFSVAQVFTGREGKQAPVAETVRGFKEILGGKHDSVPEGDFYMKGGIDEVKAN